MAKKVIVIGAGLAGLQTAYFLAREGVEVTVLERREEPALETSFANGGLMTPSHAAPWNSPGILGTLLSAIGNASSPIYIKPGALLSYFKWGLSFVRNSTPERFKQTIHRNARLSLYAMEQCDALRDDVGISMDGAALGTLMTYRDETSFKNAQFANDIVAQTGVGVERCTANDLVRLEPALADIEEGLCGGFYYRGDQHGDARQYCLALSEWLQTVGVDMRFGETVIDIESKAGEITSVVTDVGRYVVDVVVMAAGLWSTHLGRKLGLRLPIKSVKGYSATYDISGWNKAPKIPVVDDARHIGLTPLGHRIRFVGSAEFGRFSSDIDPRRVENLHLAAFASYPSLQPIVEATEPLNVWCGHRPMTPDCLPLLGQHGPDNLYLNTGHGYLGWTTACGTSRAVSDAIIGRENAFPLLDYAPGRFGV